MLLLCGSAIPACPQSRLIVNGTRFLLDGRPFAFTGVSFFNAIYNPAFNRSAEDRRQWLAKFRRYGINVLRVWAQWDNPRGFVDSHPSATLYHADGSLRTEHLATLKSIIETAAAEGLVIELTLFSQESWRANIRLKEAAMETAASQVATELRPYRNLSFQVWNELSHHTVSLIKAIKAADPERLVTNSPGGAGVLAGSPEEMALLDYLTPHTSRQNTGKPWEIAPAEIRYLLARYRKPVVDDEPARNGTPSFGGPREATYPEDHILQIWRVWNEGAYVNYHHDMFQTGAGSPPVPPSGIPDPEFSSYHRRVFEFLARQERYRP
jgi:hypothetical protein